MNERAVKDTELLNNRLIKLQQDFDSQLSTAEQLAQENNQRHIELKVRVVIFEVFYCLFTVLESFSCLIWDWYRSAGVISENIFNKLGITIRNYDS